MDSQRRRPVPVSGREPIGKDKEAHAHVHLQRTRSRRRETTCVRQGDHALPEQNRTEQKRAEQNGERSAACTRSPAQMPPETHAACPKSLGFGKAPREDLKVHSQDGDAGHEHLQERGSRETKRKAGRGGAGREAHSILRCTVQLVPLQTHRGTDRRFLPNIEPRAYHDGAEDSNSVAHPLRISLRFHCLLKRSTEKHSTERHIRRER